MSGCWSLSKSAIMGPLVLVSSYIPASLALSTAFTVAAAVTALSTALTGAAAVIGAVDAAESSLTEGTPGCSGAREAPTGVVVDSAGAAAAWDPERQMVSTFAGRPTAHTCSVPGAFSTSNISLLLVLACEIAAGKAVHADPSQCWVAPA